MEQAEHQSDTLAKLAALFREVFDAPDLVVSASTTAEDIAGWDSMTHITLIVAVEQEFGIYFKASEMEGMQDVGELARLIDAKRAVAAAAE